MKHSMKQFITIKQQAHIIVPACLHLVAMECCGHTNYLRITFDREESNKRKDKRITMAQ